MNHLLQFHLLTNICKICHCIHQSYSIYNYMHRYGLCFDPSGVWGSILLEKSANTEKRNTFELQTERRTIVIHAVKDFLEVFLPLWRETLHIRLCLKHRFHRTSATCKPKSVQQSQLPIHSRLQNSHLYSASAAPGRSLESLLDAGSSSVDRYLNELVKEDYGRTAYMSNDTHAMKAYCIARAVFYLKNIRKLLKLLIMLAFFFAVCTPQNHAFGAAKIIFYLKVLAIP